MQVSNIVKLGNPILVEYGVSEGSRVPLFCLKCQCYNNSNLVYIMSTSFVLILTARYTIDITFAIIFND